MTWHLLACDPNRFKIPASHRIRAVSHDEFRDLARNLEEFWKDRAFIVRDSVDLVVLRRLTGLKVLRCSLDGIEEINHEKLPKRLARGDFVLAFQPLVDGMYVNWAYDRADTARFKEMVATWVIEPSDGKYLEPLRITSLARQFAALNNKIDRTIELLAQSKDGTGDDENDKSEISHFQSLLEGFKQQKARLRKDPVLCDIEKIKELLDKQRESIKNMVNEIKLISAKLTIEEAAAVASAEARSGNGGVPQARKSYADNELECKRLVQSRSILEEQIKDRSRTISDLQKLVNELGGGGP